MHLFKSMRNGSPSAILFAQFALFTATLFVWNTSLYAEYDSTGIKTALSYQIISAVLVSNSRRLSGLGFIRRECDSKVNSIANLICLILAIVFENFYEKSLSSLGLALSITVLFLSLLVIIRPSTDLGLFDFLIGVIGSVAYNLFSLKFQTWIVVAICFPLFRFRCWLDKNWLQKEDQSLGTGGRNQISKSEIIEAITVVGFHLFWVYNLFRTNCRKIKGPPESISCTSSHIMGILACVLIFNLWFGLALIPRVYSLFQTERAGLVGAGALEPAGLERAEALELAGFVETGQGPEPEVFVVAGHGAESAQVQGADPAQVHGAELAQLHGAEIAQVHGAAPRKIMQDPESEVFVAAGQGAESAQVQGAESAQVQGADPAQVHGAELAQLHGAELAQVHGAAPRKIMQDPESEVFAAAGQGAESAQVQGAESAQVQGAESAQVQGADPAQVHGADPAQVHGAELAQLHGAELAQVHGAAPRKIMQDPESEVFVAAGQGAESAQVQGADPAQVHGAYPAQVHGADPAQVHGAELAQVHGAAPRKIMPVQLLAPVLKKVEKEVQNVDAEVRKRVKKIMPVKLLPPMLKKVEKEVRKRVKKEVRKNVKVL